jgi:hypothetical protein
VPEQRQARFLGGHAAAVIDHADQAAPAGLDFDLDAPSAGVDGVLRQFLDHRGWPLDDLAGRDLIRKRARQDVNARRWTATTGCSMSA